MKKSYYLPVMLGVLLLWLCSGSAPAQVPSTQGTEFFITYMKNGYRICNGYADNEHLKAIVSASDACQVTISNLYTAWSATVSVPQNGLVEVEIPYAQAYNETSEIIQNKGLLVVATDTVSLVISNEATNSFDASFVLPTPVLADEYVIQSFVPSNNNNESCPGANRSCFIIIATENNTTVDITPTRNTQGGHLANNTFYVNLNRGQTYFVYSQQGGADGDLSGTRVKARDCRKIQVFNGNVLTTIPITLSNGYDHIFEQAMPIAYWGKKFVVTSSLQRAGGDFVRITALENSTEIVRNGVLVATINAGTTHEFILAASQGAAFIETSNPCAVNLYNTTSEHDGSPLGDPSMVWISPIEQQIKEIVFSTFQANDASITMNAVNLICPLSALSSMQLDGANIGGQFLFVPGNADYAYARITIPQGTHHLSNATGFVGHVYGFGYVKGYAYSIGSSMINLNRAMYINDILSTEYGPDSYFCQFDTIKFSAITAGADSVIWDMGNGSRFYQDSIRYRYNTAGTFPVMNIVKLHGYNCLGHLYDTLRYNINIEPHIDTVIYDTVCYGKNYSHWGFQKDSVINDWHTIDSTLRCNSRATLYLTVAPIYHHFDTIALHPADFPFHYWNYTYDHPGTYSPLLHTRLGCDSLITLTINLMETRNVDICETEYYDFYGAILSTPGTYTATRAGNGCDTLITLNLGVHPHKQTHFDEEVCIGKRYHRRGFDLPPHDTAGVYHYQHLRQTVWGCDSLVTLTLQVPDVAVKILTSNPDFCETYQTTLTAATPNSNIRWSTGETTNDITVTHPGTYIVFVAEQNCEDADLFTIERCPALIVFPSAITPGNADNINDWFHLPAAAELEEFSIFIYDRWGECVFTSTDPYFRWDGKFKGKLTQGVYNYVATYRVFTGRSQMVSGVVTVM